MATISNAAGSQGLATTITVGTTNIAASSGGIAGSTVLTITAPVSVLTTASFTVGSNPEGIAIDASGNVWVTNSASNSVTELTASGAYKNNTLVNSSFVTGVQSTGIAIDASGNVWVADYGSGYVTELNASGAFVNDFVVGGYPVAIAIDASGYIWVANSVSNGYIGTTVTKLTASGAYANGTLANSTFNANNGAPMDIAIDSSGNVWVASGLTGVVELNASGAYINGTQANSTFPIGGVPSASLLLP